MKKYPAWTLKKEKRVFKLTLNVEDSRFRNSYKYS